MASGREVGVEGQASSGVGLVGHKVRAGDHVKWTDVWVVISMQQVWRSGQH